MNRGGGAAENRYRYTEGGLGLGLGLGWNHILALPSFAWGERERARGRGGGRGRGGKGRGRETREKGMEFRAARERASARSARSALAIASRRPPSVRPLPLAQAQLLDSTDDEGLTLKHSVTVAVTVHAQSTLHSASFKLLVLYLSSECHPAAAGPQLPPTLVRIACARNGDRSTHLQCGVVCVIVGDQQSTFTRTEHKAHTRSSEQRHLTGCGQSAK